MSINIRQLKFAYRAQGSDQLDINQWQLEAGQHVFLHGPSGCGKTTLLKLICGLLTPSQGQIQVLEQDISLLSANKRDAFRAQNIGYIAQSFNLIPYLSVVDNIQLAQMFAHKRSAHCPSQLLTQLNIEQSLWQQSCESLSMGQQQRVAIARALVNQPKLVIADEPTSSLDENNAKAFMQLLQHICAQHHMSLLFVSHDMRLADYFSQVQSLPAINNI